MEGHRVNPRTSALLLWLVCSAVGSASAQLFGERTLGSSLTRPTFPDSSGGGPRDPRFLRGTEEARTFVGAELLDLANPVGLQQALGLPGLRSAVDGLREELQPRVNRVILEPPPAKPLPYRGRLRVDFDYTRPTAEQTAADLTRQLRSAMIRLEGQPEVSVTVRGRTAILEGAVSSHRTRALAEQLVRLEPGVSRIENRVQVLEPLPEPETLEAAPEPPAASTEAEPSAAADSAPALPATP